MRQLLWATVSCTAIVVADVVKETGCDDIILERIIRYSDTVRASGTVDASSEI